MELNIDKIVSELKSNNYRSLNNSKISEKYLLTIAEKLRDNEKIVIKNFLNHMVEDNINENCDWNIGSIIQHFNINEIINQIDSIPVNKRSFLYDSIGLAWVLGDSGSKDEKIVDFLYEVLNYSRNSEAWWRSAFAIEKLTRKNAINNLKRSLKNQGTYTLKECLCDLQNKRKVVGLLFHANSLEIKNTIYPELKEQFKKAKKSNNRKLLLNVIWLFGRLRLYDTKIYDEIISLLNETDDYEIIYYIFQSISDDPKEIFHELFLNCLDDDDPLIRKMALRGLSNLNSDLDIRILEKLLEKETNEAVIGEITKTIYNIKNSSIKMNNNLFSKYLVNENGLIGDDSDKWYADAAIYNIFSDSEDVENVCFNLVKNRLKADGILINNPVDLATGTGRTTKNIVNNLKFEGTLYSVDLSVQMLDYLQRSIDRQKYYVDSIKLVNSSIENFKLPNGEKSSFIISSFGFPSKIFNKERCISELKAVYENLSDDGVFITIGWDETFNDELNEMWYRYIPDNIVANSFENWRNIRSNSIKSARNCELTWYKKNLQIPLLFSSLEETINVMGHLFGRDAASNIILSGKTSWWMTMGITWDTKESLKNALIKMGEKI